MGVRTAHVPEEVRTARDRAFAMGWLAAIMVLGACEREAPARQSPVVIRAAPETTMIPVRPPPRLVARDSLPARIYYDLTRFEWYARGEPLRWADRDWQPDGNPLALETETLRLVGEFEGVDVWIRADEDPVMHIYVPVSEGFWLRFASEGGNPR